MFLAQEEELAKFSKCLDEIAEKVKLQSTIKTNNWLDDEYDALQERDRCTRNNLNEFITSTLGTNLSKNRFNNVLANESTLVHLTKATLVMSRNNNEEHKYINGYTELGKTNNAKTNIHNNESNSAITALHSSANDYINANFIDLRSLFHVPFTYIAAQSPLPNTVNDFWYMIFIYNVQSIVMLCAEVEEGQVKSEKYWPNVKETRLYGQLTVRTLSETVVGSVVHRQFLIRPASSHDQTQACNFNSVNKESYKLTSARVSSESCTLERIVEQLQYIAWPHQSIPSTSVPLSYMMHKVGSWMGNTMSPIVVHCSGGLGRSGVFIAIHIALARFELQQLPINLFDIVAALKQARTGMVQSREQYLFLYFAVRREMQRLMLQARNNKATRSLHQQEQEWLQRLSASSELSLTPQALSITSAVQSVRPASSKSVMINDDDDDNNKNKITYDNYSNNRNVNVSIMCNNNISQHERVNTQTMINNLTSWRSFHYSAPALMPIPSCHSLSRRTSLQSAKEQKWSPKRLFRHLLALFSSTNHKKEKTNELEVSDVFVCDAQIFSKQTQKQKQQQEEEPPSHHKKSKKSCDNNKKKSQHHSTENNNSSIQEYLHTNKDDDDDSSNKKHALRAHIVHSLPPATTTAAAVAGAIVQSVECTDNAKKKRNDSETVLESSLKHLQGELFDITKLDDRDDDDVFVSTHKKQERQETEEYIDVLNKKTSFKRAVSQSNEMSALHSLPVCFSSVLKQRTGNTTSTNCFTTNEHNTDHNKFADQSPAVLEEKEQEPLYEQVKAIYSCADTKEVKLLANAHNVENVSSLQKENKRQWCNSNTIPTETNVNVSPQMTCTELIHDRKVYYKNETCEMELSRSQPAITSTVEEKVIIATTSDAVTSTTNNNNSRDNVKQKTNESHQTDNDTDDLHTSTCQNIAVLSHRKLTSAEIALL